MYTTTCSELIVVVTVYGSYCVYYDLFRINRDDDDDEDEPKSCFKSAQNRVCCSLEYIFRYIGTPNFREKVLWVYSRLKFGISLPKTEKNRHKAF